MARKAKEEIIPIVPREELAEYLKANHRLFTVTEMARNAGYTAQMMKTACDNEGLIAITIGERVKDYIESHMHLTLQQQCDKLEMKMDNLKYYYKQFGFDPKKAGKGKRVIPSLHKGKGSEGTPLELLLGPIARSYYTRSIPPLETISTARSRLFGEKLI